MSAESTGKPSRIVLTMVVTIDGKEASRTREYHPRVLDDATSELMLDDLFRVFGSDLEEAEAASLEIAEARGLEIIMPEPT